jgi:AsmA protein
MLDQRPPGPAKRRMRVPVQQSARAFPWLAVAGYAGLGLICLVLGALTFLIVAQPLDLLRERVVAELKASTGHDLVIAGATSLSLLPRLAVSVEKLSLSAAAGDGPTVATPLEPTLTVERLDVELGLLSLLGGEPSVSRVVLMRPRFEVRRDGIAPGSSGGTAPLPATRAEAAGAPQAEAVAKRKPQAAAALDRIASMSVRIIDGEVRYRGSEAGQETGQEISAVNADVALGGADGPLHAKGSLMLHGETMTFDGSLSSPAALLNDHRAQLTLRLAGQPVQATFVGEVAPGGSPQLDGQLNLAAASTRALAAVLGRPFDDVRDPGPLRISATLGVVEGRISLAELDATVGDTALAGAVMLETARARPYLSGTLRLGELNIGRLLLRPGAAAAEPNPTPPSAQRTREPGAQASPLPQGLRRSDGDWSDERIDLNALALADADLKLSVERIVYKELATGPSNLAFALQNKFAKLTLADMRLYAGQGQGVVTLDATHSTPAVGANLALEGVSALPLLKDAMGFEWLEGRGSITLALAGQGASARQVVSGLNGKVAMNMSNGAIRGGDVAKILHAVEQARFEGFGVGDKTQFSEFAGSLIVTSGIAQNHDLRLISPRVQVSGSGSVALAARSIDYTARARILGGAPTPGAIVSIGNLEIPLRIEGPWSKPNVSVVGQENLLSTVKQIGKNLNSQDVQDALKGLFGDGEQRTKPSELLDKLFKKQP